MIWEYCYANVTVARGILLITTWICTILSFSLSIVAWCWACRIWFLVWSIHEFWKLLSEDTDPLYMVSLLKGVLRHLDRHLNLYQNRAIPNHSIHLDLLWSSHPFALWFKRILHKDQCLKKPREIYLWCSWVCERTSLDSIQEQSCWGRSYIQ